MKNKTQIDYQKQQIRKSAFSGERRQISEKNLRVLDSLVQAAFLINTIIDNSAQEDDSLTTDELQFAFLGGLLNENTARWAKITLSFSHLEMSEMCNAALKRLNERTDAAHVEAAAIITDARTRASYF